MGTSSALWIWRPLTAFSKHFSSGWMYTPRPGLLPTGSKLTSPAGLRTTRISSRFGAAVRQPTQVRMGTCFLRMRYHLLFFLEVEVDGIQLRQVCDNFLFLLFRLGSFLLFLG